MEQLFLHHFGHVLSGIVHDEQYRLLIGISWDDYLLSSCELGQKRPLNSTMLPYSRSVLRYPLRLREVRHEPQKVLSFGAFVEQLEGLHSPVGYGHDGRCVLDLLWHLENGWVTLLSSSVLPSLVVEVEAHLIDEYYALFLKIFQPVVW